MSQLGRLSPVVLGVCVILGFLAGKYISGLCGSPGVTTPHSTQAAGGQPAIQNASVNAILDVYEQLSGKHFIRDSNLNAMSPLTINYAGLGKDETLKLISESLLLNGVAIIPVDDQTLKVITTSTNKNPRSEGIRIYTRAADLPVDDQIVNYYMPLTYISPGEAQAIFCQTAPVHDYGAYVPAPSAHAIILTENVSTIRKLIELRKLIDISKSPTAPPQNFILTGNALIILSILIIVAVVFGNLLTYLWFRKASPSRPE